MYIAYWEIDVLEDNEIKAVFFLETDPTWINKIQVTEFYIKYIRPVEVLKNKDYRINAKRKHIDTEVDNNE